MGEQFYKPNADKVGTIAQVLDHGERGRSISLDGKVIARGSKLVF